MAEIKIYSIKDSVHEGLQVYLFENQDYMDMHPSYTIVQAPCLDDAKDWESKMNLAYSGGTTRLIKQLTSPLQVTAICKMCGINITFYIDQSDLDLYKSGTAIQDALPYIIPAFRELLLSGLCPDCWDEVMSEDNDNDNTEDYE